MTQSELIKTSTLALIIGAGLGLSSAASAQSADSAQTKKAEPEYGGEIVVTAQKRAQDLLDVPISIAALSGEALQERNLRTVEDISLVTPGLTFDQSSQFFGAVVSIRGIASIIGASTTGYYIDELPLQQRDLLPPVIPHVFDLERLEVLRGPQGTLYGAGSMGGTLRFIRPEPDLDVASYSASAEGSLTNDGSSSGEGSVIADVPLVDGKLGFRGGVFYRHEGGWIDRADRNTGAILEKNVNTTKTLVMSGILKFAATDTLTISPSIFYQKNDTADMDVYWDSAPKFVTYTKNKQPENDKYILYGLNVDFDAGPVNIKSVTSYLDRDFTQINDWTDSDGAVVANYILGIDESQLTDRWTGEMYWTAKQKSFSQELRFSSADSGAPLQWIAGLYYQRNKSRIVRNEYQDINAESIPVLGFPIDPYDLQGPLSDQLGLPVSYFQDISRVEKEIAGFANLTYQITPELSASAGARVSRSSFTAAESTAGFWLGDPSSYTGKQAETPFSPRFNITYQPDSNSTYYASVAKGFRVGGTNPDYSQTLCAADLPPEGNPREYGSDSLWSYELGSKNRFAAGRGQINVSAYHIDWSNIQSPVTMPTCLNVYFDNLGSAKVDGVDADLNFRLAPGLTTQITAGYTNARFTETIVKFGTELVRKGQSFPAAKFKGSASLSYDGDIGNVPAFGSITVSYAGRYDRNGPDGVSGADALTRNAVAVTQLSARAGVELSGVTLAVFAENLTNAAPELIRTRLFGNDFGPAKIISRTLRPRTIGISANLDF